MQYLDGLTDEHKIEIVVIAEHLQAFRATLANCIEVKNRSFLIDPDHAESLANKLNKKGFDFKIPAGDSIRTLLIQLHTADLSCVQQCAAEFVCKMVHKGYDLALTPDELQAVNSCLVLLEDKLDLS
jgi:hypothetical protein